MRLPIVLLLIAVGPGCRSFDRDQIARDRDREVLDTRARYPWLRDRLAVTPALDANADQAQWMNALGK